MVGAALGGSDRGRRLAPADRREPAGRYPGRVSEPAARLVTAVLHVRDLERAAEFYETVLGLRPGLQEAEALLLEDESGARPLALRRRPGTSGRVVAPGVQVLIWTLPSTADLDQRYQAMQAAGLQVFRHDIEGTPALAVSDPEGHRLLILSADQPVRLTAIPADVYTYY